MVQQVILKESPEFFGLTQNVAQDMYDDTRYRPVYLGPKRTKNKAFLKILPTNAAKITENAGTC